MLGIYTDLDLRIRGAARKLVRREEGAGIVEYLLLVVFIALALIGTLFVFRGQLENVFSRTGDSLNQ